MIQRNIFVDFARTSGKMKAVNCVNGGPLFYDNLEFSLVKEYREIRPPYVRTYGMHSERFVDIHAVFPDFNLDPRFEGSYNFAPTDKLLSAIKEAGAEIYLRLGESRQDYEIKRYNRPPLDYEKWASIAEHVIAHYNQGWGGRMKLGIKYVEIMCDVDDPCGWCGTPEEYYRLYTLVAKRLKEKFPRLRVGAYSSGGFYSLNHYGATEKQKGYINFLEGFLSYVTGKDTAAPLDFFSWKCLAETPEELSLHSSYARNYLNQYGLRKTQSIISEFNLASRNPSGQYLERDYPSKLISSLIIAEKSDAAMMFYSDLCPHSEKNALYSPEDKLKVHTYSAYRALRAFGELSALGKTVESTEDYRHAIYSLATTDGERGAVIVATRDYNGIIEISLRGASFSTYSITGIVGGGDRGDGFFTSMENLPVGDGKIKMRAGKNEVYLITLSPFVEK